MRRHLWVLAGLLAAALVVGSCGGDDEVSSGAPGFSGSEREIDHSPFSMAEPRYESSATTLPGSPTLPLPEDIAASARPGQPTAPPTSSTTTSTTTTMLPGRIVIPSPDTIYNLCGFSYTLTSLRLVPTTPSVDLPALVSDFRSALTRYEIVAPSDMRPAVQAIRDQVELILGALKQAGYDVGAPRVRELIGQASRSAGPFDRFNAAAASIDSYEQSECPGR